MSFAPLPVPISVGEAFTFYVRINVEYFPNNHVFGLSNMPPEGIVATCNTGPIKEPYGNGGLRYDDLYMVKGEVLSSPIDNITF